MSLLMSRHSLRTRAFLHKNEQLGVAAILPATQNDDDDDSSSPQRKSIWNSITGGDDVDFADGEAPLGSRTIGSLVRTY